MVVFRPLRISQLFAVWALQWQFNDVIVGLFFGVTMLFISSKIFPLFEKVDVNDKDA